MYDSGQAALKGRMIDLMLVVFYLRIVKFFRKSREYLRSNPNLFIYELKNKN